MSEIDYEKLAETIAQKLRLLPPADKVIWTAKHCAGYLGMSQRHFVDRVSKSHSFPSPIKLPSDGGRGHSVWYAAEIQDWVKSYKRTG